MDPDFWHNRWENNLIGFHLDEVNPYLQHYWSTLAMPAGSRVLVPLCGKSLDLVWLAEQGHEVIGIEISPIAVKDFFAENHLQARRIRGNRFDTWQSEKFTLLCGDVFELTANDLGRIDAVYDRAALIALPPEMRRCYVNLINRLVPASAPHLLISLDYEQSQMDGPPFAVSDAEIRMFYGERFEVDCLQTDEVLEQNARFREKGLTWLKESVYRLTGAKKD